jgi:DNA-binding Lrp family transcriptional regulator
VIKIDKRYALDERDEKIIRLLSRNARAAKEDIAETLGVTRSAITQRIKKMEDAGVIKSYTVVIDWNKVLEAN